MAPRSTFFFPLGCDPTFYSVKHSKYDLSILIKFCDDVITLKSQVGLDFVGEHVFILQVNHYATVACQRLERIGAGGKRSARRPQMDDIDSARKQIFQASLFGNTLREVMQLQASRWPNR